MDAFDYVIVGAGSAGCALAARLTEDPNVSALVLEHGGSDRSIFVQMPSALSIPMNDPRFDWGYWSDPEPGLNGRRLACPRGKTLGGSSSINGMVWVRGHALDFEEWREAGAAGWGYGDCLPYFRRAERWIGGEDDYRGASGPVGVCNGRGMRNPLYRAFVEAGRQAGYGRTEDYNGHRQEGFGPMHMSVDGGRRASTANAYLRPALGRPNLELRSEALAERIEFDHGRAARVAYRRGAGRFVVEAKREIVLAAGAIGSPALLQRSGVGPGEVLRAAGIEVLTERPGVGANLQDHLEVYFQFRCKQPITLNGALSWPRKAWIGARWLLRKDGLGATNHFESCGFIRSKAGRRSPDIQFHFLPGAIRYDGKSAFDGHGFQLHVGPNKPKSRGRIAIRSADPRAAPSIRFDYLSREEDVRDFRTAIRLSREIVGQEAMDPYRGAEIQPGAAARSDAEIDAWIREAAESAYHPSCACKMGAIDDAMAVVDPECRVIGLEGLRVVDSSVFPTIPNGNLNAPTIMLAEKAADAIAGRPPLAPSNAPWWEDPRWSERQRENEPERAVSR